MVKKHNGKKQQHNNNGKQCGIKQQWQTIKKKLDYMLCQSVSDVRIPDGEHSCSVFLLLLLLQPQCPTTKCQKLPPGQREDGCEGEGLAMNNKHIGGERVEAQQESTASACPHDVGTRHHISHSSTLSQHSRPPQHRAVEEA